MHLRKYVRKIIQHIQSEKNRIDILQKKLITYETLESILPNIFCVKWTFIFFAVKLGHIIVHSKFSNVTK
jgi:hypothetical protein